MNITKWDKSTKEKSRVSTEEFLDFVSNGPKTREKALAALIDGYYYQNAKVAYGIESLLREQDQQQHREHEVSHSAG